MAKPEVTFGGVKLAANDPIVWRFQAGSAPYSTILTVHKSDFGKIKFGEDKSLKIKTSRRTIEIKKLTALYEVTSNSPNRRSFVISDLRWRWQYPLIVRDYNITKQSGRRATPSGGNVPFPGTVTVDEYLYRSYSLKNETDRWTAREVVKDVFDQLSDDLKFEYSIASFPVKSSIGEFTLQNIVLRDNGDAAVTRALSFIPGADVWVDASGTAQVFNAANIGAAEASLEERESRWGGDVGTKIDKSKIRPKNVNVYYQRELEMLVSYDDNMSAGTQTRGGNYRNSAFCENVLPTVDPETSLSYVDVAIGKTKTITVPPGVYIRTQEWLDAMDDKRSSGSILGLPWTWETIQRYWYKGLGEALGEGREGFDLDPSGELSSRIGTLRRGFRQTFRINRNYMERIRDVSDRRVGLLDPVTGAQGPALVWSQIAQLASTKGKILVTQKNPEIAGTYVNLDYLQDYTDSILQQPAANAELTFVNRDTGVFRVDYIGDPYGYSSQFIPCHLVNENNTNSPATMPRDLARQDRLNLLPSVSMGTAVPGFWLRDTHELRALVSFTPGAPNNKKQLEKVALSSTEVQSAFASTPAGGLGLDAGDGPDLEVFVPPTEAIARFAWKPQSDRQQEAEIQQILGIGSSAADAGLESINALNFINKEDQIDGHAKAVAAEALLAYADDVEGSVMDDIESSPKVEGTMAGVSVIVPPYPSGKVHSVYEYAARTRPIGRFSLADEGTRHITLGVISFQRGGDK